MRAATLTAIGMAILVVARLIYDKPGSSLAAAIIAGLFLHGALEILASANSELAESRSSSH